MLFSRVHSCACNRLAFIIMGCMSYGFNSVQLTSTYLWVISALRLQMLHCLPASLFILLVRKLHISDLSVISSCFMGRLRSLNEAFLKTSGILKFISKLHYLWLDDAFDGTSCLNGWYLTWCLLVSEMQGLCGTRRLGGQEDLDLFLSGANRW